MADNDMDDPDPPSAKAITALLREARSLSRRADKLGDAAAKVDDPTTQQLAAEACTSMEQLVHHLSARTAAAATREGGSSSRFLAARSAYGHGPLTGMASDSYRSGCKACGR
jgi:hypothetical protein